MHKKLLLITFIFLILISNIKAQNTYTPQNHDYDYEIQKAFNSPHSRFFTSSQTFLNKNIKQKINYDSIINIQKIKSPYLKIWKRKVWDKIFNNDLVKIKKNDYCFSINPLMNFSFGRDFSETKSTYTNTRGIELKGKIGNRFYFYSSFHENQSTFVNYLDSYIRKNSVVPGQGNIHTYLNNGGFDYAYADGFITYDDGTHFNIQFGHGKNFIGDGYRSLLLSDNSFNYPFLKITTNFWHIKYTVLYAQFQDLRTNLAYDMGHTRKYGTFHYLTWAATKRFNISFFETLIWQSQDTIGYRGFDVNYLNPVIFLRPVEFSVGSPDNALMGLNISYIIGKHNVLYGQLLLDEFKLKEVISGNGWWANKQAFQLGLKSFDVFKIKNLYFQTEFNSVRPYTYSHRTNLKNYGHYNQPLAHPIGANFYESVNFIKYHYKRFYLKYELQYCKYGENYNGLNYGKDIFESYQTHVSEHGNYIGQGLKTSVIYNDIAVSYLINPSYNLNFEIGYTNRLQKSDQETLKTSYFHIGLKTSLFNTYYDI